MRSRITKRTPSGRKVHPQGKKDGRNYQPMKRGTSLVPGLKGVCREEGRYSTLEVSKVLLDKSGRSYKNLRVITKGSIILLSSGVQAKVISRTNDHIICQTI